MRGTGGLLPPLVGEGWGRGVVVLRETRPSTATPTPNPSPQGGGEHTAAVARPYLQRAGTH